MSTSAMMERIAEASPRFKARVAGLLYLIIIVGGIFAEIIVRGWRGLGGADAVGGDFDFADALE